MTLSVDMIILIDGKTCESLVGYSWFGLDYFVIGDGVIMRWISLISVIILHVRSFMPAIGRLYLLVT